MPAYDNIEECNYRLRHTYVIYDGQAAFVDRETTVEVGGERKVAVRLSRLPYSESKFFIVPLEDERLIYTVFPLGYINYGDRGATYLRRVAMRGRQQGVNQRNVVYQDDEQTYPSHFSWNNILQTDYLNDLVSNKYPSMEEAVKKSSDHYKTHEFVRPWAVHRRFSVAVDGFGSQNLYYKGSPVARRHESQQFVLPERCRHLLESLNEIGVPVK
jgi:hypothetical protein